MMGGTGPCVSGTRKELGYVSQNLPDRIVAAMSHHVPSGTTKDENVISGVPNLLGVCTSARTSSGLQTAIVEVETCYLLVRY